MIKKRNGTMILNVLFVLCSVHSLVNGVGFRGLTFQGMEEPESITISNVEEGWISQPLDHFNHRDNRTWLMRYYENSEFLNENSPILIMIGGEWEILSGYLQGGLMYQIGSEHNCLMYYTEHRYYGRSRPTKDTSTENLRYLNVDQALADLAYFIETKKRERDLKQSIVIVFGCSYAGNMAAWARLKYPHLVQGALASSAPVRAKVNFYEYYEVVTKSLGRYSESCVENIKIAIQSVEELLTLSNGPETLKSVFNLCQVPLTKDNDLGYFMNIIVEVFASTVQYDKVEGYHTKIEMLCGNMTATDLGSPLQRLAHVVRNKEECLDVSYDNFVKKYREISWDSPGWQNTSLRQWYYQSCMEFGYYQTSGSNKSIFGTLFPLKYYINLCIDFFDDYCNETILESRVNRTNRMYGGQRPEVTNVIFTNGDMDPWHELSVVEDLNAFSPAILIKGTSHCRDLHSNLTLDVDVLKEARAKVRDIIGKWINS